MWVEGMPRQSLCSCVARVAWLCIGVCTNLHLNQGRDQGYLPKGCAWTATLHQPVLGRAWDRGMAGGLNGNAKPAGPGRARDRGVTGGLNGNTVGVGLGTEVRLAASTQQKACMVVQNSACIFVHNQTCMLGRII